MTLDARIRHDIEARIRSGDWRPGHRIPTEQELCANYSCARATVSKALTALSRTGLIERRKKAGSFVAYPHLNTTILEVPDIGAIVTGRGEAYRWVMASVDHLDAVPAGWRDDWPDAAGPVLGTRGVHWADAQPLGVEERLIDLATVPEAATADFGGDAPGSWLLGHVAWSQACHRIRAVPADTQVGRALAIAPGAPCLRIERWTWRATNPVTYARQTFRGDRYDLSADFRP